MNRFVIDTDPGIDDAHAIMMAFAHPDTQIEAITTVVGNVPLEHTTANACTILDVLEGDVPVYAGCSSPLITPTPFARHVHGADDLGDSGYPPSVRKVADEHAVNALVRLANDSPGELTLIAIGPLTNLALATRLDPALPTKYKRLVVMGGAIHATGIVTPVAEFNAYSDPEALAIVIDAWKGLTLISWESTVAHAFNADQIETLLAMESPRAEFFRRITQQKIEFIHETMGRQILPTADGLAMAVAVEPDIVRKVEMRYVQVELAGHHTRGQTVVDWDGKTDQEPNVNLVLEVNPERFWELMQTALR